MAAHALVVNYPSEVARALGMLSMKYPEYAAVLMPKPEEVLVSG
jgi:hypothetical protein